MLRNWLLRTLQNAEKGEEDFDSILTEKEREDLARILGSSSDLLANLVSTIRSNSWTDDRDLTSALESPLMRLCARYLYLEKHRGLALCPVANFHLRNGAVLWRLNWRADLSARGLANSCGVMVNYKYFLEELESNSAAYQNDRVVKADEQVKILLP